MSRLRVVGLTLMAALALLVPSPNQARATTMKTPVLLVHGINGDFETFSGWTSGLSGAGSGPNDFTLKKGKSEVFGGATAVYVVDYSGFDGAHGDIPTSAQAVSWAIAQIKKQTGASKVFVVVHSMGGLLTRTYLESLGSLKYRKDIAGFVTLDTPHMGCAFADSGGWGVNEAISRAMGGWFDSKAGQQMDPDSRFLNGLNSADYTDSTVKSTFVVGNHYPLLGDGLLTAWEQVPYMNQAARLHRLADYRIEFVDAVHNPETGQWYYQALLGAQGKTSGSGRTLRPIVDTWDAKRIAKAAYDRVATDFEAKPTKPAKPSTGPSKASLDYATSIGGKSHKGETLYFVIGESFKSEAAARRKLKAALPLYDVQMYYIVQRSDSFRGMSPGWWVVIEARRDHPSEDDMLWYQRAFPQCYVKKATVLTVDPIPVYEDLVPGSE